MTAIQRAVEEAGGQEALANAVGVSQGLVSQWVSGAPVHTRHFRGIEKATRGAVTPHELLADEMEKFTPKHSARRRAN